MSYGFSHNSKDDVPSGTYSCSDYPNCDLGPDCQGIHSYSARYLENDTSTEVVGEQKDDVACENQVTDVIVISDDDDDLLVSKNDGKETNAKSSSPVVDHTVDLFTGDLSDAESCC